MRAVVVLVAASLTLAAPWVASAEAGVAFLEFAEKRDSAMEVEVGATVAGTGCKRVSVTYVKTNGAWNDLYKYGQRWGFCWNSRRKKITSLYGYERFKQCCDPGWSFVGHVGIVTTG
jgi:hypothetical protein